MNLIALKNFRNVPSLGLKLDDANNNNQVDKGEFVEIGSGKKLAECNNHDKEIIAQLTSTGCVAEASDDKLVAQIKAEAANESKRKKTAKELGKEPAKAKADEKK